MTTLTIWRGCVVSTFRSYDNLDLHYYEQLLSLFLKLTMLSTDSKIFFKLILENQWLINLVFKLIRQAIIENKLIIIIINTVKLHTN